MRSTAYNSLYSGTLRVRFQAQQSAKKPCQRTSLDLSEEFVKLHHMLKIVVDYA